MARWFEYHKCGKMIETDLAVSEVEKLRRKE